MPLAVLSNDYCSCRHSQPMPNLRRRFQGQNFTHCKQRIWTLQQLKNVSIVEQLTDVTFFSSQSFRLPKAFSYRFPSLSAKTIPRLPFIAESWFNYCVRKNLRTNPSQRFPRTQELGKTSSSKLWVHLMNFLRRLTVAIAIFHLFSKKASK